MANRQQRQHFGPGLLATIAAGICFAAFAWLDLMLMTGEGRIAAVWVPNAVALVFLLRQRTANPWLVLLACGAGNIGANLLHNDPVVLAVGLALSNILEIAIAFYLCRRLCGFSPDLREMRQLGRFAFSAGIVAPLFSAALAMFVLATSRGIPSFQDFAMWAVTDSLGMLTVAPVLMILLDAISRRQRLTVAEARTWAILTIGGTSITVLVFIQSEYPLLFLIAPVVVIHAFFLGAPGTAFSLIKVATISTVCTLLDLGPISDLPGGGQQQLIVMQLFLATNFVISLPIAALLHEREMTLEALKESRKDYKTVCENITDSVLRYDLAGRCIFASPSAIDVQGVPPEEMVGSVASERVHEEARGRIEQATRQLVSGQVEKDRFVYRRYLDDDLGRPVFIEATCGLVRDSATNLPEEIVVSTRDVTERVNLEKDLVRARRHAENAVAAKSQFLANMSHEIRTPMNGVLGFAQLLLTSDLTDEQRAQVELIAESGSNMMSLLSDILDIAKIESRTVRIEEQTCEIRSLLKFCVEFHAQNAKSRGLDVAWTASKDLPDYLVTDPLRLRQILHNLVGNAVKFTSSGSISVHAGTVRDQIEITVSDTGIGIAPDHSDLIFEPFKQVESEARRSYGGSGLGLAISRQLAELLGGSLRVTSAPGKGSTFTLLLPLRQVDMNTPENQAIVRSDKSGLQLPRRKILLAEDHPVNRRLVEAMLEKCGQEVVLAEDGMLAIEAVKAAKDGGHPVDLILMDIQMPNCDGHQAATHLRNLGYSEAELPIIALTANAYEEDVTAAIDAGMQSHIAKPVKLETLKDALVQWLA
ncbi:ATP-binding protein [Altererythrobacter arenosus]|uniref:histidine kinase n=1 Tax=Altererythrobacter arenosus TaxID=3032592 RepID=A0ABY8FN08_9SPHN|nr:ATP-binding protein [Altererythrobacter sp. CAU 1644]WFL76162.1 ATP-binding protein [Altererythrobacter sp. CAU 1644]